MKKKILIGSISVSVLVCLVSFFLLKEIFEEEVVDSKEKYIAAKSGLNLRANPDKSSKAVTLIPFGVKVTIEKSEGEEIFLDDRYGKWVNVKYGNKAGWVFSGFLCDFKPDEIIKIAADYYRDKNKDYFKYPDYHPDNQAEFEAYLINFDDSQISIEDIIDNHIVLEAPEYNTHDGFYPGLFVWKYDAKQKKFFEFHDADSMWRIYLLYIDNDRYPDLVVHHGADGGSGMDIYLGSKKGFKNIFVWWDNCNGVPSHYPTGSCGDMEFSCYGTDDKKNIKIHKYFRFNCDKRKIEKYEENILGKSKGVIKSIDLKSRYIVIRDEKDLKDKTYYFYKWIWVSLKRSKYMELKDLKKDDAISFEYEILKEGEKIFEIEVID